MIKDYYLRNPAELRQPKRQIGDFVEANGILVPRRFGSLREARASGLPVIVRSEHPQDYDGCSGLLASPNLTKYRKVASEDELKVRLIEDGKPKEYGESMVSQYCGMFGMTEEQFYQDFSFSFWQKIQGFNRTVVADTAIPNRFHVSTCLNSPPGKATHKGTSLRWLYNYTLFAEGQVEKSFIKDLPPELKKGLPELIDAYQNIRNLWKFDPNHCPIMEFQTTFGGKNYFLQYHRTRDFDPAVFELTGTPKAGCIEAMFVRGATPPGGINVKATRAYYHWFRSKFGEWELPETEEASFDTHWAHVFPEIMVRRRKAQIKLERTNLDWCLREFVVQHLQRSKLYKPEISLIVNSKDFEPDEDGVEKAIWKECRKTNQDYVINLNIISDGRKALISRV